MHFEDSPVSSTYMIPVYLEIYDEINKIYIWYICLPDVGKWITGEGL